MINIANELDVIVLPFFITYNLKKKAMEEIKKDEYVRILDFLPRGKMEVPPHKRKPLAQAIGEDYFSLLEIIPRKGITLNPGDKIYIGEKSREKVDHIERRIKYEWLTPTAKSELNTALEGIIKEKAENFVTFYNTAGVITTRQHKLDLLPRIGRKHRQDILEERKKKPFKNFQDMQARITNIPSPAKVIAERIIQELKGEEKYALFVPIREIRGSRERNRRRY